MNAMGKHKRVRTREASPRRRSPTPPDSDVAAALGGKKARSARLLEEAKNFAMAIDSEKCDEVDAAAKDAAHRLKDINGISALCEQIEILLRKPPVGCPALLFSRTVLSHLPSETLRTLNMICAGQVSKAGYLWRDIVSGDVLNSADMRELARQRRALLLSFLEARKPNATQEQKDECANALNKIIVPVFTTSGELSPAFRVSRLSADELAHPTITRVRSQFVDQIRREPGSRSGVPLLDLYRIAFEEFSGGLLRKLDWTKACSVGSAPLACMLPLPREIMKEYAQVRRARRAIAKLPMPADVLRLICEYSKLELRLRLRKWYHGPASPWRTSDLDIFIVAETLALGKAILEQTYREIVSCLPGKKEHAVVRTPNSLTIVSGSENRNVQLLLGVGLSVMEFPIFCDFGAVSLAFTGNQVLAMHRAVYAINTRTNFVTPACMNGGERRSRIAKYSARGFDAIVFEICKHWPRCDMQLDDEATETLVRLSDQTEQGVSRNFSRGNAVAVAAGYDDASLPTNVSVKEALRFALKNNLGSSAMSTMPIPLTDFLTDDYAIAGSPVVLRGVRFRLDDVLRSPRSVDYLFKCYQCQRRSALDLNLPERAGLGLCKECVALNATKLSQWDDIKGDGKVALVTGGRIKIGYQICLRLLRSGFAVICVSRFPNDSARRFLAESDSGTWHANLHVYGVDLRHLPSVHAFIEQTIRRPRAYYRPLVDFESKASTSQLPGAEAWHSIVASNAANPISPKANGSGDVMMQEANGASALSLLGGPSAGMLQASVVSTFIPSFAISAPLSAALTQIPLIAADADERDEKLFPLDKFDEHGEPADLRDKTSWNSDLTELSPVETLEAHIVNAVVPLLLMQSFLPQLTAPFREDSSAYVVNVSSPEGLFDSAVQKDSAHVHTNMSKAALNMMVRTLAPQLAKQQRVYLSAVDTGWVTRMQPAVKSKWQRPMTAPLSDRDGAARVLDPVAAGMRGLQTPYGVMLRNYQVVPW